MSFFRQELNSPCDGLLWLEFASHSAPSQKIEQRRIFFTEGGPRLRVHTRLSVNIESHSDMAANRARGEKLRGRSSSSMR